MCENERHDGQDEDEVVAEAHCGDQSRQGNGDHDRGDYADLGTPHPERQDNRTQERDAKDALELLAFAKAQPVVWHHSDDALCSAAAKLKAAHKISFADSFVAALAQRLDAALIHKDPEFKALGAVLKQQMLPAKSGTDA